MDDIEKFIRKLGADRAISVRAVLVKILKNDLVNMDVRKIKGEDSLYRVRIGKVRIKFVRTTHGNVIAHIGFRDDNTYR